MNFAPIEDLKLTNMGISNMTLVKIGAIGGMITVSMGLALRTKLSNNVKETVYYKEALKTLRTNRGAVYLLGEPMKDGTIDVSDLEKNYTKDSAAHYEVPIKGPKKRGVLHFWANKDQDQWRVNRVELGLEDEPNRRLLIKNE